MRYDHLHPRLAELVEQDKSARLELIKRPRWIGYTRAQNILTKLEGLLRHPQEPRMPGMLIVGRSNNGKTRIVERFTSMHLPDENLGGERIIAPVLHVESPPTPSEAGLYKEIFEKLYESTPSGSVNNSRAKLIRVLTAIQLKVLIIDEMHNLLAGASTKQQAFLNVIKYLTNRLQICIVGCGTADLLRAVSTDSQIENRFTPEILPLWKSDKEFQVLMKSFESFLPLRSPSNLHETKMGTKILAMSEGTIGEISQLLNKAAIHALNNGQESICTEILDNCGYTPPSQRQKLAARI